MEINDIIDSTSVLADLKVNSKKQLLQELSEAGSKIIGMESQKIFETLLDREQLGSTGVGNGVAIPHGKIAGMEKIVGVFAQLNKPVSFDAVDDQPIDIAFMLLAPVGSGADHLKALSRIARLLRNQNMLASIRGSADADAIYALLTSVENEVAA